MNQSKTQDFLFQNINTLKGVGIKTKKLLKKKKSIKIQIYFGNYQKDLLIEQIHKS